MDELLNEHEQGERVRSWLQRNAVGLIGGIGLGLALIWGWNWWQGRQVTASEEVAARYDAFEQAVANNPAEAAKLSSRLAETPYAAIAAMELAKSQVDAGQDAAALATLQAARGKDPAVNAILRQRIATLLIATGKPADAVTLLAKASDAGSLEVLGDAQASLSKPAEAQKAYREALRSLEEGSPQRQVVQLKLAEAGG